MVTKVAENTIGLTAWSGWTGYLGGSPLEDQLREKDIPFEHVELPHLLTTVGACWLTFYTSPLRGKPVTVLTVPVTDGWDDPGEFYYYFEGMTRERALENENWWLDNIDTMRQLFRDTFRRAASGPMCCICARPIVGHGNNADPVAKGQCDDCNQKVVIPARIEFITGADN